jgi:hypothetical protein
VAVVTGCASGGVAALLGVRTLVRSWQQKIRADERRNAVLDHLVTGARDTASVLSALAAKVTRLEARSELTNRR